MTHPADELPAEDRGGMAAWRQPTQAELQARRDRELVAIGDETLAAWVAGRAGAEAWWTAARREHARHVQGARS